MAIPTAFLVTIALGACSRDEGHASGPAAVPEAESQTNDALGGAPENTNADGAPRDDVVDIHEIGEDNVELSLGGAEIDALIAALQASAGADPELVAKAKVTIDALRQVQAAAPKTAATDQASADARKAFDAFLADPAPALSCDVVASRVSAVKLTRANVWSAVTTDGTAVTLARLATMPVAGPWASPVCAFFAGGKRTALAARHASAGVIYVAAPYAAAAYGAVKPWTAWSPGAWTNVRAVRGPGPFADLVGTATDGSTWLAKSNGQQFTRNLQIDPATWSLRAPTQPMDRRLGVSYAGATYDPFHAPDRDSLPRAGQRAKTAGFSTFKLMMSPDKDGKYDFGSHLSLTQVEGAAIHSLADLAKVAAYDQLFRSDIQTFVIDTGEFHFPRFTNEQEAVDTPSFVQQVADAAAEQEAFCGHILKTYENTGKVFISQTWESDHAVKPGVPSQLTAAQRLEILAYLRDVWSHVNTDAASREAGVNRDFNDILNAKELSATIAWQVTPSPLALAKFKAYVTARQRAVDRCRVAVKASGVWFYNMVEITDVFRAKAGQASILNDVLHDPAAKVDVYGWSAYSATADDGQYFLGALNYYRDVVPDTFAFGANNVMVSEIGMYETQVPAGSATGIPTRYAAVNRILAESLTESLPYYLYWTLYDDSCDTMKCDGNWIYKSNGDEGRAYRIMKPYLTGTDALVAAAPNDPGNYVDWLYWLMVSRRPTDAERRAGVAMFANWPAAQARVELFQVIAGGAAYYDRTLGSPTILFLDAWRILAGRYAPGEADKAAIYTTQGYREALFAYAAKIGDQLDRPSVGSVPLPAATPPPDAQAGVVPRRLPPGGTPFAASPRCTGSGSTPPGALTVSYPLNGAVAQRDADNRSNVYVRGSAAGADCVEARTTLVAGGSGTVQDWVKIADTPTSTVDGNGSFVGLFRAPAGGWYQLEIRAFKNGVAGAPFVLSKFGIGEVFVIAGQSNSANGGESKQVISPDGKVMRFDGYTWGVANDPQLPATTGPRADQGSVWPLAFDTMSQSLGVPIGLSSVGFGGSSIVEWMPDGVDLLQGPDYPASIGFLYKRLVTFTSYYGPRGVRAILWHQGETDSGAYFVSGEHYENRLRRLMSGVRLEVGYDVNWVVARTGFVGWQTLETSTAALQQTYRSNMAAIQAAQNGVADNVHTFSGPNTNALEDRSYRFFDYYGCVKVDDAWLNAADGKPCQYGGIHFSNLGLVEAGKMWRDRLVEILPRLKLD